jgi:hypothetical protein
VAAISAAVSTVPVAWLAAEEEPLLPELEDEDFEEEEGVRLELGSRAGVVLAGVVRDGVVLAGVVLAGVVLAGVVLAGVVLAGVVLAGVVLGGVVLAGVVGEVNVEVLVEPASLAARIIVVFSWVSLSFVSATSELLPALGVLVLEDTTVPGVSASAADRADWALVSARSASSSVIWEGVWLSVAIS